jgi:hypothetical protein
MRNWKTVPPVRCAPTGARASSINGQRWRSASSFFLHVKRMVNESRPQARLLRPVGATHRNSDIKRCGADGPAIGSSALSALRPFSCATQ